MQINRGSILIVVLALLPLHARLGRAPPVFWSPNRPTEPPSVPPDVGKISVFFSRPMNTGSWSLGKVQGTKYPPIIMAGSPWKGDQALILVLDKLDPGTRYGLQLSGSGGNGFKAADDGSPLAPTDIVFTTGGSAGPAGETQPGQGRDGRGGGAPAGQELTEQQRVNLNLIGSAVEHHFPRNGPLFHRNIQAAVHRPRGGRGGRVFDHASDPGWKGRF